MKGKEGNEREKVTDNRRGRDWLDAREIINSDSLLFNLGSARFSPGK